MKDTGNPEFGALLKNVRDQANLKQKVLAQAVHCADSEISRFERGRKLPSQQLLHSIINIIKQNKPNIEEEQIEKLWKLAGYVQTPGTWQESPPANPLVLSLNQLAVEMYKRQIPHELVDKALEQALIAADANLNIFLAGGLLREREWKKSLEALSYIAIRVARLEELNAKLFYAQAQAYYGDGDYLSAINFYNKTLRSLYQLRSAIADPVQSAPVQYQIGETLSNIGSIYRRKSQMTMAEDYYKQAEKIFSDLNCREATEMQVNSLRKRAGIANYLGQANKAIELLERCNAISTELDKSSPTVVYKNWQHLGWSYRLLGRWDEAIELNLKAFDLIQEQDPIDKWEVMKAHIYLGESYRLIRNGDLAKTHYQDAQQILNSIQDEGRHAKLQEGMILFGLGRIHLKRPAELHLAENYLIKSLELHYQLGEELMVAAVQNELGELHTANDQFEQALDFLLQSRDYFKNIKAEFYYLSCLASICKCYYKGRDYFKSRGISKISEIIEEVKNTADPQMQTHLAKIKLMAGAAQLAEDRVDEAAILLSEALKHAISFNNYVFMETWDEISEGVTLLTRKTQMDSALLLLRSIQRGIEEVSWSNDQKTIAIESMRKIKAKEKEIQTFLGHTKKRNASK